MWRLFKKEIKFPKTLTKVAIIENADNVTSNHSPISTL